MNKKLRLMITDRCINDCPMCCNKQFDLSKIPIVDNYDYEEVSITGGEPGLVTQLFDIAKGIRFNASSRGRDIKLYLYTSLFESPYITFCTTLFDGIVLTPHKERDIPKFIDINNSLLGLKSIGRLDDCSLRLNLFNNMKTLLPEDINLSLWKVKDIEWIKDCPIPEGEDFRRIKKFLQNYVFIYARKY